MTMITPSYLGETIEYSSLHACRSTLEDPTLFVTLNKLVAAKDEALTIGHSYFMLQEAAAKKRFTKDLLEFLWRYRILPLAAEYEYELNATQIEEKYGLAAVSRLAGLK